MATGGYLMDKAIASLFYMMLWGFGILLGYIIFNIIFNKIVGGIDNEKY
jgi:hypothetical protein